MVQRTCIECGRSWKSKPQSGRQPGFCSDECRKARKRATYAQWYQAHREQQLAYSIEKNLARKQQDPDYFKQHYAKHRDRRKRAANEWYHANAEQAIEKQKAYIARQLAENPEHYRALKRKHATTRRARKRDLFVEVVDPRVVFDRDHGRCGIWSLPVDRASAWEVDHIVPIAKGGVHSYANVQLAHRRCNRSKAARVA